MGPTMPQFRVDDYGQEVTGSTLGIVGMGGIGYEAAKRAYLGFNMNVLYHNRRQRSSDDEKMVKATYYSSLHAMLPECDFVVIACALTPETTGMFGEQEFQLMKKTASIINVSRGPLINQEALATALTSGEIRSAALDVTAPEPLPRDHPLLKCPNCVIIPHYGSATFKTRLRMMRAVMDDIVAVLGNQQQKNELVLP